MVMRSTSRHFSFGAIGEEVKAARGDYVFDDDCDGG